jgi:drug/metabolite transporter (DMT)-like permease
VLLTGLLLAGYVGTWFAALQRAPASVVTSVLVLGAVVTGALTAVSKGAVPSATAVVGYLLIVAAAALIVASSALAMRSVAASSAGRAALSTAAH